MPSFPPELQRKGFAVGTCSKSGPERGGRGVLQITLWTEQGLAGDLCGATTETDGPNSIPTFALHLLLLPTGPWEGSGSSGVC